jgi:Acetyltransferase (GNAT) domain
VTLGIRPVSLTNDRAELIDILTRNFGPGQDIRFDWRHLDNPVGEAWGWFAYEQDQKNVVATVSVFPRRMFVDGKLVVCGQVGAFAVDPSHRSLGPAVLVQRTTFEPVDSGALAFCYDCPPHDRGMSTFVRLGMQPNCEVTRYALPLRSDEFLEKRLGRGAWTRPLAGAANAVLALRTGARKRNNVEISALHEPFGEDFSDLDARVGSRGLIRASRSAELLNWRYRQNPGSGTEVLVARRSGELMGFLSFWVSEGGAYIVDLFGLQLADTAPALLDAAIEICKRQRIASLHGYCSSESELRPLFLSLGFRPRERDARVVAYENAKRGAGRLLNHGLRWPFGHVELMV